MKQSEEVYVPFFLFIIYIILFSLKFSLYREIKPNEIVIGDLLGSGTEACVYKGKNQFNIFIII